MTNEGVGFGQVGPGLRLLLTGTGGGPAIPAIAETIGKKETLARMENGIKHLDSWV
jgi:glutamyl-tRNA synthetase